MAVAVAQDRQPAIVDPGTDATNERLNESLSAAVVEENMDAGRNNYNCDVSVS
jgi:hypothetical protein